MIVAQIPNGVLPQKQKPNSGTMAMTAITRQKVNDRRRAIWMPANPITALIRAGNPMNKPKMMISSICPLNNEKTNCAPCISIVSKATTANAMPGKMYRIGSVCPPALALVPPIGV